MAKITIELDDELIARLIAGAQVLRADVAEQAPAAAPFAFAQYGDDGQIDAIGITDDGRDSAGVPWDARIHSATGARNSDGTWRKRRGVDPALVEAVTAELTAQGAEAGGAVEQDSPPAPTVAEVCRYFDVPPPPASPGVEAANAEIPPPTVAVAPVRTVSDITLAVATGRVLLADLVALCVEAGVSGVHELAGNPGALSFVVSALEARGVWSE